MTKVSALVVAGVLLLVLNGCAPSDAATSPSEPSVGAGTDPTPTPTPTPDFTSVDPTTFATHFVTLDGKPVEGVDFNSVDGNLHCGIFSDFAPGQTESFTAFGGCTPLYSDYEPPRPEGTSPEVGCQGAFVSNLGGPTVICNNGAVFMGDGGGTDQAGNPITIAALEPGTALSVQGITCAALDASTIRCALESTGHGFVISRTAYTEF